MVPFFGDTLFSLYIKISIYIAISNETFFDLIHFSDKMMLKKLHTKEKQKTIYFGWDKPTQDRNKKHMSKNKYIVYTWICLKTRCLFLVPKRVLWEEKRTPHFETTPPHTHLYIHIYICIFKNKHKFTHTHIYIYICIYITYIYTHIIIYTYTTYIYIHILNE